MVGRSIPASVQLPAMQCSRIDETMSVSSLFAKFRKALLARSERGTLLRAAGGVAALKMAASGTAFLASLIYARALGPTEFGMYAYVVAWSSVIAVPAGLGMAQYLVREHARQPSTGQWLRRWADRRVAIAGVLAACILFSLSALPSATGSPVLFLLAAPVPLLAGMISVRVALLQARGRVVDSQWPQLLLGPASMLMAMLALWFLRGTLSATGLIALYTGSSLLTLLVNNYQLHHGDGVAPAEERGRAHLRRSLPFVWLGMLYLVNSRTDVIMLGALKDAASAGVYSVATRAADLVTLVLIASNSVIAPRIARLFQEGNEKKLQRLISASARYTFLVTLPLAVILLILAEPALRLFYGAAFAHGATALRVLCVAQLFNVAAGPTATVLNMTGHERISAYGVGLSAVANIVMNAAFIPRWGLTGAAWATGLSLVGWNVLLWIAVRRTLSLRTTALGV